MKRVRAEVLSTRKLGAYHQLTVVAPEIAEKARPGQFVAVRMPEGREFLLRRHLAIHDASRRGGWAGTLEFVIDPGGPGTSWMASARAHSFLDMIGPLGKSFSHPRRLTNCLLVAERHGAATLYFLAQELGGNYQPGISTWVKSPPINVGKWTDVHLQYRRWQIGRAHV